MELVTSVDFHGAGFSLKAGEKTYTYPISDPVKTQLLADHPTWFTEITALNIAADEALAVSLTAEAAALKAEALAAAAQIVSDAAAIVITAGATARTAADDAAAAYVTADGLRD